MKCAHAYLRQRQDVPLDRDFASVNNSTNKDTARAGKALKQHQEGGDRLDG
jgi:hypothetical protein